MFIGNESCHSLHEFLETKSHVCEFVKNATDCRFESGFVQYFEVIYCNFSGNYIYLGLFILFIWCLILLLVLAIVADEFFGPSLVVIAKILHLSDNLAGVTLLALGNGAADIFSAIAAAQTAKEGDGGLMYGSLLGAGILVTTVTTGCVAAVKPFTCQRRPVIKDILFYIVAILWNMSILLKGYIHLAEAVGFIVLYVIYVFLTVISRSVRTRMLNAQDDVDKPKAIGKSREAVPGVHAQAGLEMTRVRRYQGFDNQTFTPEEVATSTDAAQTPTVTFNINAPPDEDSAPTPQPSVKRCIPRNASTKSARAHHRLSKKLSDRDAVSSLHANYLTRWVIAYRSEDDALIPSEYSVSKEMTRQRSASNLETRQRSVSLDIPPVQTRQRSITIDHCVPPAVVEELRQTYARAISESESPAARVEFPGFEFESPPPHAELSRTTDLASRSAPDLPAQDAPSQDEVDQPEIEEEGDFVVPGFFTHFLHTVNPIDSSSWEQMACGWKVYEVIRSPVRLLLILGIPVVDEDHPTRGWCKLLIMLQCVVTPILWLLALEAQSATIGGVFPVWALVILVGVVVAVVIFFTSSNDRPPRYHYAFAFVAFATAIVAIYTVTNEIVNILPTFGASFRISKAILALTFLAWANSVGDIMSNTILAKNNFPRIAISACFGGPVFNLLLGIGIPFIVVTLKHNYVFELKMSRVQLILIIFLLITLVSHLFWLAVFKFSIRWYYGIYFFVLYVIFLTCALLVETKVIPP